MIIRDSLERKYLSRLLTPGNAPLWQNAKSFARHLQNILPSGLSIKSLPPPINRNYNCFVHAMGLSGNHILLGNRGWPLAKSLDSLMECFIENQIYIEHKAPHEGCVVIYRNNRYAIQHMGIVAHNLLIESKWSWGPTFLHSISLVPSHYGNVVEFYSLNMQHSSLQQRDALYLSYLE